MSRRPSWWMGGLVAALVVLGACGGADDDASPGTTSSEATTVATSASTPAPTNSGTPTNATPGSGALATVQATQAAASRAGSCEGTVGGGVTASFKSGGGASAVNSDYWFTEADLIQGARFLGETEEQVRAKIAAKQFVFYPLILNCGDSKTGLNFLPNAESHNDFPFGPKTYRIPPAGVLGGTAEAGELSVLIVINDLSYKSSGGTFEVKKFDKSGIAGSFTLDIEEAFSEGTPKTAKIAGTFDMPCTGSNTRSGCSR